MTALQISLLRLKLDEPTPELELALMEAEQAIRNYCNFEQEEEIPSAANFIWANMATDMLKQQSSEIDATPQGALTSITEGDTSYGFAAPTKSKQEYLAMVSADYAYQLNSFRRFRWA